VTTDTVFQITSAAKRILDPSVAVVVNVDADGAGGGSPAVAAADTYTVDYLFGKITFASALAAAATVTVTGAYLTPVDVAEAKQIDLELEAEMLDASTFTASSDGYKRRAAGLKSAGISISTLNPLMRDLDGGAGSLVLKTLLTSGTPFLVEERLGASGEYFRGWFLLDTSSENLDPNKLHEATVTGKSAPVTGTGQTEAALFGWGS
jgi:hypothetical protein